MIVILPSGKTSKRFLRRFKSFRDIISPMLLGKWTNSFELKSCVEIINQNKKYQIISVKLKKLWRLQKNVSGMLLSYKKNIQWFVRKLLLQVVTVIISLLFLVSAGISWSFDSAMLVTTQSICTKYFRCS